MEQVLQKIQELHGALVQATGAVANQTSMLEDRAGKLNAQEVLQSEKQMDQDAREIEIAKVEDVIALKEEGLVQRRLNTEKEQDLIAMKAKMDEDLATRNADINRRMSEVVAQDDRIEKEWGLIKQERAQLERDKETYKNDVVKEILKGKVGS